jgi:hypothetical protein
MVVSVARVKKSKRSKRQEKKGALAFYRSVTGILLDPIVITPYDPNPEPTPKPKFVSVAAVEAAIALQLAEEAGHG